MKMSYSERDYAFGQTIQTLRNAIGLTQGRLGHLLGISRRAVAEWEAGNSYPSAEHLRALIVLAVQQQAFPAGHEAEAIRVLWKAARQKLLLDEHWLSTLLDQWSSPSSHVGPPQVDIEVVGAGQVQGIVPTALREKTTSNAPVVARSVRGPKMDCGDALMVPTFYGRAEEQDRLFQWVVQEHCRVVSVLGMGGIGKSALAVSIMHRLAEHFEVVVFRSLRDAPACEVLLDECFRVLCMQIPSNMSTNLEGRIGFLLSHLRKVRTLVVLDNLESLLQEGDVRGRLRPGFEGYGQFVHRVAQTDHQSCLLLTSREKPVELRPLEGKRSPVRSLRLTGLDAAACRQLLMEEELIGTESEQERLIETYAGNPLALKMVAETIVELFGGEIGPFLAQNTVLFGSITDLLSKQFARLSTLEQNVLCWLAIVREPVTLDELLAALVTPLPRVRVLEAVDGLRRRSLIERGKRSGSFTLQSVVLEYMTAFLITRACSEIQQRRLDRLIQYGLEQAHAREYVRQAQERLLIRPLLTELQSIYPRRGELEERLLSLLDQLREQADAAQGYGPVNLIALLRLQRGHLSDLDLSQLSIRGAYLQSIEMQDTSLVGALLQDTVWTEAVNATWAVAISLDGKLWAAGSMQGKVRVWEEGGQTLHLIWQAHTSSVQTLAFSPDGRTLASGSLDSTVKLWDVSNGTLLWMGWQDCPQSLAFSPDSNWLASGGLDATVRLWEPQSGVNLQTLTHPGYVFAVAFSPDGSLLASGGFDGEIRLWEGQKTLSATSAPILSLQANGVRGLAFAPDGRTLASSHWDGTVKLWEVGSHGAGPRDGAGPRGRLLHTLPKQTDHGNVIAWSPDGRTLARCYGQTIQLWDIEQDRCRGVLSGHTARIYTITFTPDSSRLLSGSADSTLRVWDVTRGQCMRVIAGYAVSLYDVDWSPDGTCLVSGGSDALVTIWDLSGRTPPRVLRGHNWIVYGVRWSPDGKFVASSGWDTVMRLWNPLSGACVQAFENPTTLLEGMGWSPDGSLLACGTHLQGVQVWDVTTGLLRWAGRTYLTTFLQVAWSPDGRQLVGGGTDGNVYLWKSEDGTLLQRLSGHQGKVMSVVWSPDGTRLASGSGSGGRGEVFVWDMQQTPNGSGDRKGSWQPLESPRSQPVQTFLEHPGMVYALAWSRRRAGTRHSSYGPRGDLLISGGSDGMLRWWDVQNGGCVCIREAHRGTIRSLRVSPNGRQMVSCGEDGAIMIWDLESFEHVQTLRRDRPYERLKITGIRGLTEAQKTTLQELGAIDEAALGFHESKENNTSGQQRMGGSEQAHTSDKEITRETQAHVSPEQRQTAKREIVGRIKQGASVETARLESPVPMPRATVYRLLKRVETEGEIALIDRRRGHPVKLRGEVLTFLIERCQVDPGVSSSAVQRAMQEHFGHAPSISQLNRVRASLGLSRRPTT